jgi:hypothetical protein
VPRVEAQLEAAQSVGGIHYRTDGEPGIACRSDRSGSYGPAHQADVSWGIRPAEKVRRSGSELDITTVDSIRRAVPTVMTGSIDQPGPTISDLMSPPDEPAFEPDPPIEANLERENAPNEANSHVQAPSRERGDGRKDCRIDTPHIERKPSGIGNKGKEKIHPALERALGGRNSNLVNLSSIFGEM